jgi:hypothetical protein
MRLDARRVKAGSNVSKSHSLEETKIKLSGTDARRVAIALLLFGAGTRQPLHFFMPREEKILSRCTKKSGDAPQKLGEFSGEHILARPH